MPRLLIDERIRADGQHARAWASVDGGALVLEDDGVHARLPVAAIERVMLRFGRELDPEIAAAPEARSGDALACTGGVLRRFRFHAIVDTEARDYLLWERAGQPPLAALATTVTAALRHLATARISGN